MHRQRDRARAFRHARKIIVSIGVGHGRLAAIDAESYALGRIIPLGKRSPDVAFHRSSEGRLPSRISGQIPRRAQLTPVEPARQTEIDAPLVQGRQRARYEYT